MFCIQFIVVKVQKPHVLVLFNWTSFSKKYFSHMRGQLTYLCFTGRAGTKYKSSEWECRLITDKRPSFWRAHASLWVCRNSGLDVTDKCMPKPYFLHINAYSQQSFGDMQDHKIICIIVWKWHSESSLPFLDTQYAISS